MVNYDEQYLVKDKSKVISFLNKNKSKIKVITLEDGYEKFDKNDELVVFSSGMPGVYSVVTKKKFESKGTNVLTWGGKSGKPLDVETVLVYIKEAKDLWFYNEYNEEL